MGAAAGIMLTLGVLGLIAGILPWQRVATWGVPALLLGLGLLLLAVPDAVPGLTIPGAVGCPR